ncbi:DUF1376 family (YdaU), partial [Commensalibacter communis]
MAAKESGYKWSKFYWDDWANDGALQSCNLTAQGLWMHLLRVMFNNERQGYLQINNKAMSALQLSKLTGLDSRTIKKQLSILIENNVCSVDENGIVFSRRMVRESQSKNRKSNVSATSTQHKRSDVATSMQQPCSEGVTCMHEENAENSQKQDALNKNKIDKNRIDISNKLDIPPKYKNTPQAKSKRGSRLPDDWLPDEEDREYARNLGLDVIRTIEDFCGHWHAKAGKDAIKLDWSLTWKNWCRKARD